MLKWMLGIEVVRDRKKQTLEINQSAYIRRALEKLGLKDCKLVATPMEGVLNRLPKDTGSVDHN